MKSKVRKIIVDSETYVWSVTELDWHMVNLKVWIDGNKNAPWFEVQKKFDDPWINFSELSKGQMKTDKEGAAPVTPRLVASIIKEMKNRKLELIDNSPIYLRVTTDGGLSVKKD